MKIFIVNGMAGGGKTTFEKYVCEIAKEENINIEFFSIIQIVKTRARMLGWKGEKTKADRKFLHDLKIALSEWKDVPFEFMCRIIEKVYKKDVGALFIDMREAEDIDRIKQLYEVQTILVRRRDVEKETYGNIADDNVLNYSYDIVIENNGSLEELKESARTFYENFIKEIKE